MTQSDDWRHDLGLDLRGLACPLPVLKTRKALQPLASGQRLLVEASDPLAAIDIPHFVSQSGDRLVVEATEDGVYRCVIERGVAA
jgi:tRNA 2-thiouridine synthesizing protein A